MTIGAISNAKLNLCCGYRHVNGIEWINIDNREECNPDLLWDIELNGLTYFDDNSVDEVRAHDALEHISSSRCIYVMEEIYRVLKPNGILDLMIPSTDGRGAFQDFTHKSYWNQNSFFYFMNDDYRNLYGIKAKFKGNVKTIFTDVSNKILHVIALLQAVKDQYVS
jgi:predicted SAM-dependent methyltransferase